MYESVLARLVGAGQGAKLVNMPSSVGLERTRGLLHSMSSTGQHSLTRNVLHVVGTNGKGTVAWKAGHALHKQHGLKVGLYTSPHLFSLRERIRINGEPISPGEFAELGELALASSDGLSSYFELVTCMALQHFANHECDAVVLEAGMGGLGDATNVLPEAKVVCLTHVALDHCRVLGHTLPDICREKLGVVKPNSRVVIGPSVPRELDGQIMDQCRTLRAYSVNRLMFPTTSMSVEEENGKVAAACVELFTTNGQAAALKEDGVRPPCRVETFVDHLTGKRVVLDVGHNPSALQRVFSEAGDGNSALVFGIAQDKDLNACLQVVRAQPWRRVEFTQPHSKARKFTPPNVLREILNGEQLPYPVFADKSVSQALRACLLDQGVAQVVCCGSHALMLEAIIEVTNAPPALLDPFDTNEQAAAI
ncbi:hypothetical protein BASA81_005836 [Batrachochytrium salamandrivorans]|nr:hypothetical protein BASA81_005836 [Batrachochytrium salamandrivorans]